MTSLNHTFLPFFCKPLVYISFENLVLSLFPVLEYFHLRTYQIYKNFNDDVIAFVITSLKYTDYNCFLKHFSIKK